MLYSDYLRMENQLPYIITSKMERRMNSAYESLTQRPQLTRPLSEGPDQHELNQKVLLGGLQPGDPGW